MKQILIVGFAPVFGILLLVTGNLGQTPQIRSRVEEVVVPVSVKDSNGGLVTDLNAEDFTVYEDGKKQTLSEFTSDPEPLSAVVLIDTGMGGDTLRSLTKTWTALSNTFKPVDEVSAYRFDHFLTKLCDFTNDSAAVEKSFDPITKIAENKPAEADIPAEPLAGKLPDWLSTAIRSNSPTQTAPTSNTPTPSTNSAPAAPQPGPLTKAFHDAVFQAGVDLTPRPAKRKVILVISDGRVTGGNAHSLNEAKDVMLRAEPPIQFFGIGAEMTQPLMKRNFSILDSYATPTGGDVFFANSAFDIEDAFAHAVDQARSEYTLYYVSNNERPKDKVVFRNITVKLKNPRLHATHRNGYYQTP